MGRRPSGGSSETRSTERTLPTSCLAWVGLWGTVSLVIGCPKDREAPAPSGHPAEAPADHSRKTHVPAPPRPTDGSVDAPSEASPNLGHPTGEPAAAPREARHDLNVLLLSIDSLRSDMPWSGYGRPIAPRLTELESRSVSYTRAYAVSSYTAKSLGGLLSGRLPSELKRDGYFFATYAKEVVFFPELLQKGNVATVAAHAHGYFKPNSGLNQGFDRWELVPKLAFDNTTDKNVTSEKLEALAEELLSAPELADKRFFAWFHFMDPHDQYLTHEADGVPAYGPKARDRYDNEVLYTDRYVGRLLDFVAQKPWAAKTAIVVTADHGEALGEHGQWAHGFELWENLVHVPLFFVIPGASARRIEAPRSALDLAPTFCEMLGVSPDPAFRGTSLVSELYGAPAVPRDVPLDLPETSDNGRRRALVSGTWKLVSFLTDSQLKVYDLAADPGETAPITRGEKFEEMRARYLAYWQNVPTVSPYGCREDCLNGAYRKKGDKAQAP